MSYQFVYASNSSYLANQRVGWYCFGVKWCQVLIFFSYFCICFWYKLWYTKEHWMFYDRIIQRNGCNIAKFTKKHSHLFFWSTPSTSCFCLSMDNLETPKQSNVVLFQVLFFFLDFPGITSHKCPFELGIKYWRSIGNTSLK